MDHGASLVAQMVKRLPTMQETQVQSLSQEDLLEKEMATHSNILAWKIPCTEALVVYLLSLGGEVTENFNVLLCTFQTFHNKYNKHFVIKVKNNILLLLKAREALTEAVFYPCVFYPYVFLSL